MKFTTNKIRLAALLLAVLLLALTGCGAANKEAADSAYPESNYKADAPMAEPAESASYAVTSDADFDYAVEEAEPQSAEVPSFAEKIIYTGNVTIETTAFDETVAALEKLVQELGGFIESSNVSGTSRTYSDGTTAIVNRWANYCLRIPAKQFDYMMNQTGEIGNVTSSSRYAQNVTSQYTDYEAQLESMRIQEERLLAMLEKSDELDSLIRLEERLSEVRYEIDYLQRSLNNLDQRLQYSTIEVYVDEVEVYTPVVTVQRSFGEKLSNAFSDGWNGFVRGVQDFCLWLAESLFGLIIFAGIVVVIVLLVRRSVRKRREKKQATQIAATGNAPQNTMPTAQAEQSQKPEIDKQ